MMRLDDISWLSRHKDDALAYLEARLQDAIQTLDVLPGQRSQSVKGMYDIIPLASDIDPDETAQYSRIAATGADIRRMEQVLRWIDALTADTPIKLRIKKKILVLRSRTRGGRPLSYRIIAEIVGTSHQDVSNKYEDALEELLTVARRSEERLNQPALNKR